MVGVVFLSAAPPPVLAGVVVEPEAGRGRGTGVVLLVVTVLLPAVAGVGAGPCAFADPLLDVWEREQQRGNIHNWR